MKSVIDFDGDKYHFICFFGDGEYYESEKRFLLTGPKGEIQLRTPKMPVAEKGGKS
jgi:hypothetical protein